jgi:hypothetical protein
MSWKVVKKRLGRAGGVKERTARQHEWDRKYGEGKWAVGYMLDGKFLSHEEAVEEIYQHSYNTYLSAHPEDIAELTQKARRLRNPHAEATTGVDLQVPAILRYLKEHNHTLQGEEVVDIGTWQGKASHPISVRLSPLHLPCAHQPGKTLEEFWQEEKCLAIWEESAWHDTEGAESALEGDAVFPETREKKARREEDDEERGGKTRDRKKQRRDRRMEKEGF